MPRMKKMMMMTVMRIWLMKILMKILMRYATVCTDASLFYYGNQHKINENSMVVFALLVWRVVANSSKCCDVFSHPPV